MNNINIDEKIKNEISNLIKISQTTTNNQEKLAVYIRLQDFINEYTQEINKLNNPEEAVKMLLKKILEIYNADNICVLEININSNLCNVLYKISKEGIAFKGKDICLDMNSSKLIKNLDKNENLLISNIEDIKSTNALEYNLLKQNNITSIMAMPFKKEYIEGYILINNPKQFIGNFEFPNSILSLLLSLIIQIKLENKIIVSDKENSLISDNDIYIKTFGKFEIDMKSGKLTETDFNSKQYSNMLLYLLYHRNKTVSISQLAEIIWPNQIMDSPYSAIKNIAFRIRKICDKITDINFIVAKNGSYAWNGNLNVTIDYEIFEKNFSELKKEKNNKKKLEMCNKLFELYKGSILPNNESEFWILSLVSKYKLLYSEMVKIYLDLLNDNKNYSKMFEVSSKALKIEPMNNIFHYSLITALINQGKFDIAKTHFYKCDKVFNNNQIKEILVALQNNN